MLYDTKRSRLLYLLDHKESKEVWLFERPIPEGEWNRLEVRGGKATPTREVVYEPASDSLIALHDRSLMTMDCGTNTWQQLDVTLPEGKYGVGCALLYDPVHKLCVALIPHVRGRMQVVLFRYDPKPAKYK